VVVVVVAVPIVAATSAAARSRLKTRCRGQYGKTVIDAGLLWGSSTHPEDMHALRLQRRTNSSGAVCNMNDMHPAQTRLYPPSTSSFVVRSIQSLAPHHDSSTDLRW